MTFTVQSFSKATELAAFVNDEEITGENIVAIKEKDGVWWLFYYAS